MKRKSLLIISLFIILFGFNCFNLTQNVNAISNVNYTFIDNIFYESDDIEFDDSFNLQNESIATEEYDATYSFTDIAEGEIPNGWIKFYVASVINNLDGHDKVLQLGNITATNYIYNNFTTQNASFMEFWFRTKDVSKRSEIDLINRTGEVNVITLKMHENELKYYNGESITATGLTMSNNVWYHIKLKWYLNYTYDYWINGILYGDKANFIVNNGTNGLRLRSYSVLSFFDAFGYGWEAFYDFTDEVGLTNTAISYVDSLSGDDTNKLAIVLNENDGRFEVVKFTSNGDDDTIAYIRNYFSETYGIIELWVKYIDLGVGRFNFYGYSDFGEAILVASLKSDINKFQIQYGDGIGGSEIVEIDGISNTWYHLKTEFNMSSDTHNVWINGELLVDNKPFYNDRRGASITRYDLYFSYGQGINSLEGYVDSIGYSWKPGYKVNDNIVPVFNTTDNLIVAKDEFAFDENGELYEIGVKDACGWEGNDIDYTYLIQDTEQYYDKKYKIHCEGDTDNNFIRKYYDVNEGVYNFTLNISYLKMLNAGSSYWWAIYNTLLNITTVIEITCTALFTFELKYLDDIDLETYTLIGEIDNEITIDRELTLFIGDLCYLTYKDTTEYYEVIFPKLTVGKGLYEISFAGGLNDVLFYQRVYIDSIGVFVNGTNLNDDFGSYSLNLNSATWYSKTSNIINVNALGIFSFGVHSETDSASLKGFYNYTNTKTWNVYNYFPYIIDPSLIFMTNSTISISNIKITGVKMNDETTNFIPDFYNYNINIDESYFYVDSSNRLQFNLIANDNDTEWIELRFDILIQTTENRSIQFKSNINGISKGYVHLAYWGYAITNIYFPYSPTTTTSYLPQGYVIFTMSIIISDQDITWYDVCNGYITNLKLIHTPGGIGPIDILYFDISVLIATIIPLIILLAPALALSVKFGRKIILPMFIFMSLLCVITNLIPIWLFFVIAIACGSLIFVSQKRGVD
ncbi:adhesin [Lokiarchaeota virus WyrdV1]|nr:adhesin [Lokiarchaeota virus WyrdV1]